MKLRAISTAILTAVACLTGAAHAQQNTGAPAAEPLAPSYEAVTQFKEGVHIPSQVLSSMQEVAPHKITVVSKQCQFGKALFAVEHTQAKEGSSRRDTFDWGVQLKIDGKNQQALAGMDYLFMVQSSPDDAQSRSLLAQPVLVGQEPKLTLPTEQNKETLTSAFPLLAQQCDIEQEVSAEQGQKLLDVFFDSLEIEKKPLTPFVKTYSSKEQALAALTKAINSALDIHAPTRVVYWNQYIGDQPAQTITVSWEEADDMGNHLIADQVNGKWNVRIIRTSLSPHLGI